MRTILYLIDTLKTGGTEKSLADIVINLAGFRPIVCQIYRGGELAEKIKSHGVKVISLDFAGNYEFRKAIKAVNKIIEEYRPVIVHSMLFRSDIVSRFLKKKNRFVLINSLVSNSYSQSRYASFNNIRKIKHKLIEFTDRLTASRVDYFIANSDTIARKNSLALGVQPERIVTIYRGRDASQFSNTFVPATRNKMQIHPEKKIVLNVGRLMETKGQDMLIRAFALLLADYPNAMLMIAGEGNFRKQLEALIDALHVHHAVILLGNRNDIPQLLSEASLFVFPSYIEGLPGALVEAMMAKRVIVCSDIDENLECVDETSAFIFKALDEKDLLLKLKQALNGGEHLEAMAKKAYETACAKFDLRTVVSQYRDHYEKLLK